LAYMHNLGNTFRKQGRLEEAVLMLAEGIEVGKRVRGQQHPNTLTSMLTLALKYFRQKPWLKMEDLLLEVVESRRRLINAEHMVTL
ncbi:hypothetical protein BDV93DRAFT_421783, partial [Ceratobasidium sp. AG-I]